MTKVVTLDANKIKDFNFDLEEKMLSEKGIEFISESCQTEEEVIKACQDVDIILTVLSKITKKVIDSTQHCKAILCYGIGYDQVDIKAAGEKGIMVCNVPHYCSEEVAVHTIALILGCVRKLTFYSNAVKNGVWNSGEGYSVTRLSTMSLGLFGFGSIARNAAKYASALGLKILICDPYLDEQTIPEGMTLVNQETLLKESDILSLHAPLTDDTRHFINEENLEKTKDGIIIVNTGRGPLICEKDLVDALKNGKVKAAGLDVLESEPLRDKDHPLCNMDNVILTPHAGHVSQQATFELHKTVAENALRVSAGEQPLYIVNQKFMYTEGKK